MRTDHLPPWWVWICIALTPGELELPTPGFIFPGFGLGALAMALLCAILSLVAWIVLRLAFRRPSSGARIVTRDVNDD